MSGNPTVAEYTDIMVIIGLVNAYRLSDNFEPLEAESTR
jgi:hypothetical protein